MYEHLGVGEAFEDVDAVEVDLGGFHLFVSMIF